MYCKTTAMGITIFGNAADLTSVAEIQVALAQQAPSPDANRADASYPGNGGLQGISLCRNRHRSSCSSSTGHIPQPATKSCSSR